MNADDAMDEFNARHERRKGQRAEASRESRAHAGGGRDGSVQEGTLRRIVCMHMIRANINVRSGRRHALATAELPVCAAGRFENPLI